MKASKILDKAIKAIAKYGWYQGALGNDWAGYCIWGAINKACPGSYSNNYVMLGEALDFVNQVIDEPFIGDWNDDPDRTKQDVIEALNAAAYCAKKAGF